MFPIRDSQPSYSTPVVTRTFIVLNVLAFLYQISLDSYTANDFVYAFGFVPERASWASALTSIFLHGGWLHLIGNMVFLWVFGDNIEDILGHGRYILFYLGCGVIACYSQYLLNPDSRVPMVGASGAIAGVMGAYMVKFPHSRIVTVGWFIILYTLELPAWLMLIMWFGMQFFSGVGSIADAHLQRGGTAFFAHIGGFVAGVALIYLFKPRDRYRGRADLLW
jgi:membrane associated rhomboid family serine protease